MSDSTFPAPRTVTRDDHADLLRTLACFAEEQGLPLPAMVQMFQDRAVLTFFPPGARDAPQWAALLGLGRGQVVRDLAVESIPPRVVMWGRPGLDLVALHHTTAEVTRLVTEGEAQWPA